MKPQGNAGFELKDAGKVTEVFCDWDEKDTVAAMIHLLNAGYKISK